MYDRGVALDALDCDFKTPKDWIPKNLRLPFKTHQLYDSERMDAITDCGMGVLL